MTSANVNTPISAQVIHVLGSYQVYTMPVFDMIEHSMVRHGIRNDGLVRVAYRSAYVVLIAFVACSIPFFRDLNGLHRRSRHRADHLLDVSPYMLPSCACH